MDADALLVPSRRDRSDLAQVVALLKTHIDPELLKRETKSEKDQAGINLKIMIDDGKIREL